MHLTQLMRPARALSQSPTQATAATPQRRALPLRRPRTLPQPRRCVLALACATLAASLPLSAVSANPALGAVSPASIPARAWAADCASNEVLVIDHPDSYLRYRMHVVDEKGDQMRDQIETPDGSVARLIERDGRPLTPDEDSEERDRLNALLASPSSFARHIRSEQANKKLGTDLLKLMPDAMLWSYALNQPPLANQPADAPPLIVLDFKPNPAWSPPTIPSEALTGLEGRVWIDSRTRRMVRLEGDIFQPVNIGLGMVGHLYPGGKVLLEQTNAGGQRWVVAHIDMQFALRVLMLKTVRLHTRYDTPSATFQPIAPMTYQQAIKILLDTPLPSH
jgi:hypothetical protein